MMENNSLIKKHIHVIICSLIILALLGAGGYCFYKYKSSKTITVSGSAQAQISNKLSTYSVNIDIVNADKQKAVAAAAARADEITKAIKAFGVDAKDVSTQSLNVYQNQDPYLKNGVTLYRPGDWHASYSINVTLRDLTKSDTFTAMLLNFDNTTMYGPSLAVDQQTIDEGSILAKAVEDATLKASKIALSMGRRLGGVVSIMEGSTVSSIIPMRYDVGMGGGGSAGFPIEPGSTTISKTVTVTFRIR